MEPPAPQAALFEAPRSSTARAGGKTLAGAFAGARYLGQHLNCYLLFETGRDLLVVDQHAFHERVLYEELSRAAEGEADLPRQEMLAPLLVPVPRSVALLARESEARFQRLGFRVEGMEDGTVAVHAVPAFLPVSRASEVFEEILSRVVALSELPESEIHPFLLRAKGTRSEFANLALHERSLDARAVYHMLHATMACHSAVRAGDPLSEELVRRLVNRSEDVDFFAHCPHGRPVYRRLTEKDVSEWFLRI